MNFNLRVGHHGLFAEPMAAAGQAFDPRALALRVGRPSIYHNRNRTYDPHLGRFLQHDPNGTGQTLAGLAFEGRLGWTPPSAFDHSAWFGDGGNLYTAYGHDPVNATDPRGLFFGGLISAMLNFANRMYHDARVWTGGMAAASFADDLLMADYRGTGPLMGAGGIADDVLEGILDFGRRIEWSGLSIGHVLQPKHNWDRLGVATIDEAKYYMQSAFDHGVLIGSQRFSRGGSGTSYLYRLELWTGEVVEAKFSDTKGVLHAVDGWVKE